MKGCKQAQIQKCWVRLHIACCKWEASHLGYLAITLDCVLLRPQLRATQKRSVWRKHTKDEEYVMDVLRYLLHGTSRHVYHRQTARSMYF